MNQVRKVGRNERCPCGEGRKYKHCCLRSHEAQGLDCLELVDGSADEPRIPGPGEVVSIPGTPFTFSFEVVRPVGEAPVETDEDRARRARKDEEERIAFGSRYTKARELAWAAEGTIEDPARRAQWKLRTPAHVADMTTAELQRLLRGLGVDGSREAFVPLAASHRSAFALADGWGARRMPAHLGVFAGLAAHELWKRFCPERPSTERFEELVEEGVELFLQKDLVEACAAWSKAWAMLRGWLEPGVRTTAAAERALGIGSGIGRWVRDFALVLAKLALEDDAWFPRAREVHAWFIEQFVEEDVATPELGLRAELQAHQTMLLLCREAGPG